MIVECSHFINKVDTHAWRTEMKLRLIVLCCVLVATDVCVAQDAHRVELFGGYSRAGRSTDAANGWAASVAVNLYKSLDLVADFAGHYNSLSYTSPSYSSDSSHQRYAFLFGPRFAFRKYDRWTPFAHVLVGLQRDRGQESAVFNSQSYAFSGSSNSLCVAVGAGLDIKVKRGIAVRAIQFDGLGLEQSGFWGADYRFSTGLVLTFGGGGK